MELRADGSFHEWTIMNQSPAGAAKIQHLPELFFAIKAGKEALTIQTHPMTGLPGVKSIVYSGAHPLSRLKVVDSRIPLETTLFAYSTYKVGDMKASAVPAIAFTFLLKVWH